MHHTFRPSTYHTTIGWHEPVLQISPGDTVSTSTVDAGGADATGAAVTPEGNPQTGPFHVTGAEPGDTLVVHFHQIRPNRTEGFTGSRIAAHVLEPGHPRPDAPARRLTWRLDNQTGLAELTPQGLDLRPITCPLKPMLGCFGVAPPRRQAISCATSGPWGGNMDYNGFAEGVTVYLPVFAPGALFHLGDGHAAQADGEILGTGIEVSMDVTFGVSLRKGDQRDWPAGENEHAFFTVGNARPLDQAVQHATSEMLRRLTIDWRLDPLDAHLLLGAHVQYDVGNVFDPAYTMACRLDKSVLGPPST